MMLPVRLLLSARPCAMRSTCSSYVSNWQQWSRRRCSQHLSRCGCVHLNTKENTDPLGEPILLFPLPVTLPDNDLSFSTSKSDMFALRSRQGIISSTEAARGRMV